MRKLTLDEFCGRLIELVGDQSVTYRPNPGNAGDGVICAATWRIFDRCRMSPRVVVGSDAGEGVFIYGGGGNFVPPYRDAERALEDALEKPYQRIILLPHTIRGHEGTLNRFDDRFHIFCRDRISFENIRKHAPRASAYLADDLALALEPELVRPPDRAGSIRSSFRSITTLPLRWRRRRSLERWARDIRRIRPEDGSLKLMRGDVESNDADRARPDHDLSALYLSDFESRIEAEWITADFFEVLARADEIETDRLHVALCASVLGKKVLMHDNSYGKNRAVYDLSLRERFPNTSFVN